MTALLNTIADKWFNWQFAMLWQTTVLIAIIWMADVLIRRWAWPQVRYALWMLVLVKLLIPPTFTSPASVTSHIPAAAVRAAQSSRSILASEQMSVPVSQPQFETSVTAPDTNGTQASCLRERGLEARVPLAAASPVVSLSWKVYALFVWFSGIIVLSTWLMIRLTGLRKEYALSVIPAQAGMQQLPQGFGEQLEAAAQKLNLKRLPAVILSDKVSCPAVFGVFRPVLLMPECSTGVSPVKHGRDGHAAMSARDVEHILLHELAHIKRGDLLVHAVYMILQIVYWFNPLLWLIRRTLQNLRELCCDATVAKLLKENTAHYRQTLLETARQLLAEPVEPGLGLLGLFENSNWLVTRLQWLEKNTWKNRPLRIATIILLVSVMTVCVLPMANRQKSEISGQETLKGVTERVLEAKERGDNLALSLRDGTFIDLEENPTEDTPLLQWARVAGAKSQNIVGINADNLKLVELPCDFEEVAMLEDRYQFENTIKQKHGLWLSKIRESQDEDWLEQRNWFIGPPLKYPYVTYFLGNDGTEGVLEVTKAKDRKVYIRFKTFKKSAEEATPKSELPTTNYSATLLNGVIVELVGVCEYSDVPMHCNWWGPDGVPISEELFNGHARLFTNREHDPYVWTVAYKLHNCPKDMSMVRILLGKDQSVESCDGGSLVITNPSSASMEKDGKKIIVLDLVGYITIASKTPLDNRNIVLGVSIDQWQITATHSAKETDGQDGWTIKQIDGKTEIDFPKSLLGSEISKNNVITIDNSRQIRKPEKIDSSSQGWHASFDSTLAELKEIQVRTPVYDWVTFKDVALRPKAEATSRKAGGTAQLEVAVSLTARGEKINEHNARVRLLDAKDHQEIQRIERAQNGRYLFKNLTAGEYVIETYFRDSYPTHFEEVTLAEGEHKEVVINVQTDQVARIQTAGKIFDKRSGLVTGTIKVHFVGAPQDDAVADSHGSFSTMADRARFHQCLLYNTKSNQLIAQVEIDNSIDEQLAKRLSFHVDPDKTDQILTDPENDGIFCDGKDCVICNPKNEKANQNLVLNEAEASEQSTQNSELKTENYIATLPNGVTVELVGICEHPSEGKQWWKPDGSPFARPYDKLKNRHEDDYDSYEVLCRITGSPDILVGLAINDDVKGQSGPSLLSKQAEGIQLSNAEHYYSAVISCASGIKQANITVLVGSNLLWKTDALTAAAEGSTLADTSTYYWGHTVIFKPIEKDGKAYVNIAHTVIDRQYRVVAVDMAETVHAANSSSSMASNDKNMGMIDAEFDLPLSEIKSIQFQTQKFQPVTFKNVSLRPGIKTEVEVSIDEGRLTKVEEPRVRRPKKEVVLPDGKSSPLHYAAAGGHRETAEMLLTEGMDINAKDTNGNTPLHLAAANGYPDLCEFLIEKCADVNVLNTAGQTPLDMAALNGHKATAQLLLSKGAVSKPEGPIDITPAGFEMRLDEKRLTFNLVVSIQNQNAVAIPKHRIRYYRGDAEKNLDETGNPHSGWHEAGPIESGKTWNERTRDFHLPDGDYTFTVVLDYDNTIPEPNETNNRATLHVTIKDGQIVEKTKAASASDPIKENSELRTQNSDPSPQTSGENQP